MTRRLAPALVGLLLAGAAWADSTLELPVPGASDTPRERLNLAITIPSRITPRPQQPARERIKSAAVSSVDWSPFKTVPQQKFVMDTLRIMQRKGLVERQVDRDLVEWNIGLISSMVPAVVRVYEKLVDVHRHDALRKFGLVVGDIERFQRVIDILSPHMSVMNVSVVEMNKRLDAMIEDLKKTTGRGQIRITGIREQKDGSTLLELEVLRGPTYSR